MNARLSRLAARLAACLALAAAGACTTERYEVAPPLTDVADPDEAGDQLDGRHHPDGVELPDGACVDGWTVCTEECVELSSDPDHCGACGAVCGIHGDCADGACVCVAGYSYCPGGCAKLDSDRNNCGACGTVCPAGQTCRRGECA